MSCVSRRHAFATTESPQEQATRSKALSKQPRPRQISAMTMMASDIPRKGTTAARWLKNPQIAKANRWVARERQRKRAEGCMRCAATGPDEAKDRNRTASSSGNGPRSSSFVDGGDEREEISMLQCKVRELQVQLERQAELADQQMHEIEEMRRAVWGAGSGLPVTHVSPAVSLSPLEAQAVRVGDSGFAGVFKDRYHSLHR